MQVTLEKASPLLERKTNAQSFEKLPKGYLPYEDFEKKFSLGATSTEQYHSKTMHLSQVTHRSLQEGLGLLLDVDEEVVDGLRSIIPFIHKYSPILEKKIDMGGRVILVGSGSSGRAVIDLAAKCNEKFPNQKVIGVIAGGGSAFVRAREGFEDSEEEGRNALKEYHLQPHDIVIFVSASGSSTFNEGGAHYAAERGAYVLYFYNSKNIPERTQQLFKRQNNPVIPLCVDIGPPAIAGSTRLQAATLAIAGLGALLVTTLYSLNNEADLAANYAELLVSNIQRVNALIRNNLAGIANIVLKEKEIFSNPASNFRQIRDITEQGYVTILASKDCIREALIDATETSPTFSTNPIRREFELHKKRAEFQAYMVGIPDNKEAWEALLGREISSKEELHELNQFRLSANAAGLNAFQKRPVGKGNLLIGVAKLDDDVPASIELVLTFSEAMHQDGEGSVILICRNKLTDGQKNDWIFHKVSILAIEEVPEDGIGITETIALKQVLNLISNGSMLLMNKVLGNQMIDVRASNQKLIDRCLRLTKENVKQCKLSDKELYHTIVHVNELMKSSNENGIYTPAIVKIVLTMLNLNKTLPDFEEVIVSLRAKQELLD